MNRSIRSICLAVGVGAAAIVSVLLAPEAALGRGRRAADLRPHKGFRVQLAPASVRATLDPDRAAGLAGLVPNGGSSWPATESGAELRLDLPEGGSKKGWLVVAETDRGGDGGGLALRGLAKRSKKPKPIESVAVAKAKETHRLTAPTGLDALSIVVEGGARIKRLRLFALDPDGKNDYWLFTGASLTVGGIKEDAFADALAERYAGYRPYVVNEAVSGWTSTKLRQKLPEILARHPHARYVPIHIGGNDVSIKRPFPGGAEKLAANIEAILTEIRRAKKVPILARLTYRAYKAKGDKPAVPPEENGSGPYVDNVYDPLIAKLCPEFFDAKRKRGLVDLYGFYREHQDQIGGDGIHLKRAGYASFRDLWVELAGSRVYTDPRSR